MDRIGREGASEEGSSQNEPPDADFAEIDPSRRYIRVRFLFFVAILLVSLWFVFGSFVSYALQFCGVSSSLKKFWAKAHSRLCILSLFFRFFFFWVLRLRLDALRD